MFLGWERSLLLDSGSMTCIYNFLYPDFSPQNIGSILPGLMIQYLDSQSLIWVVDSSRFLSLATHSDTLECLNFGPHNTLLQQFLPVEKQIGTMARCHRSTMVDAMIQQKFLIPMLMLDLHQTGKYCLLLSFLYYCSFVNYWELTCLRFKVQPLQYRAFLPCRDIINYIFICFKYHFSYLLLNNYGYPCGAQRFLITSFILSAYARPLQMSVDDLSSWIGGNE